MRREIYREREREKMVMMVRRDVVYNYKRECVRMGVCIWDGF